MTQTIRMYCGVHLIPGSSSTNFCSYLYRRLGCSAGSQQVKTGYQWLNKKGLTSPKHQRKSIKYLVNQEFFLLTVSGSILILFIFSYLIFSLPIFSLTLLVIWFTLGKNSRLCLVYYFSKMERRQIKIIS